MGSLLTRRRPRRLGNGKGAVGNAGRIYARWVETGGEILEMRGL